MYLTKYGSRVHLIVRGSRLRASGAMADRVLANPNITVHWNRQLVDVTGDDWLASLSLRDATGPETAEATETLSVRGLFYAIGHTPTPTSCKASSSSIPTATW